MREKVQLYYGRYYRKTKVIVSLSTEENWEQSDI